VRPLRFKPLPYKELMERAFDMRACEVCRVRFCVAGGAGTLCDETSFNN